MCRGGSRRLRKPQDACRELSGFFMLAEVWSFLGNLASVLSLVISLYLLYRLRAEAAAIRKTARDAVERVGSLLLMHDVSEALRLLLGIKESCRHAEWTRAVDRCEE